MQWLCLWHLTKLPLKPLSTWKGIPDTVAANGWRDIIQPASRKLGFYLAELMQKIRQKQYYNLWHNDKQSKSIQEIL